MSSRKKRSKQARRQPMVRINWDRRWHQADAPGKRMALRAQEYQHHDGDPFDVNVFLKDGLSASQARRVLMEIAERISEFSAIGAPTTPYIDEDEIPF